MHRQVMHISRSMPRVLKHQRMASNRAGNALYDNVFASNISYALFVATGAIIVGSVGDNVVDNAWARWNAGKTFNTIDWSVFSEEDDG